MALKGTVKFRARIKGNGLKFPLFDFNPNQAGIDKVVAEGPNGNEILSTVHLASVATQQEGEALATQVNIAALDRISFRYNVAIEDAEITGRQFTQLTPTPGACLVGNMGAMTMIGGNLTTVHGIQANQVKAELEQPSARGEQYFGLFRSARQSQSPVEEFMHLYHLLLMLCNKGLPRETQDNVEAFILREEPAVQQRPHPLRPGDMETVYTRLRNEFGHARAGVNLDNTKIEMAAQLGGL